MRSTLTGHALQLLGHVLVFGGLGVAAVSMFHAATYYAVPFWAFLAISVCVGAPVMIAGGRINSRGRGLVLVQSPAEAASHYRKSTTVLGVYLVFLTAISSLAVLPLLIRSTGLGDPSREFFLGWMIVWVLVFCGGRPWVTRPLWRKIERWTLERI